MAMFGGNVSPLRNIDAARDVARDGARAFSMDSAEYANTHGLGDLMCEMLNSIVVSKPDKPVDFLIDLLSKSKAPRFCAVAPPGFTADEAFSQIVEKHNVVPVCLAPLVEEAKERIIDGKTVTEHCEDGKALPDNIVVKLLSERLAKPDCVEKGWLLQGVPTTKGQAQQLVASGLVPDKVVYLSAPDDVIAKAVPDSEEPQDTVTKKKELMVSLKTYRRELEKMVPIFSHISKEFEVSSAYVSPSGDTGGQIMAFLDERRADPGLPGQSKC